MYCEKCGSKLEAGARFCNFCGAPVPIEEDRGEIAAEREWNAPEGSSAESGQPNMVADSRERDYGSGKKTVAIVIGMIAVVLIAAGIVFGVTRSRKPEEKEIPKAAVPAEKAADEEKEKKDAAESAEDQEPVSDVRDYYVNYAEAYKEIVREKTGEGYRVTTWALHDMDGDGMPELFVMQANSPESSKWFVYTFEMENGSSCYLGEIQAGALYEPENREAGVIAVWGNMNSELVSSLKKEGKNSLNITEISRSNNVTGDYYSTPYPLEGLGPDTLDWLGAVDVGAPIYAEDTGLRTPDGSGVYRIPCEAYATSVLQEPDRKHSTANLSDLNPSTAWVEGAAGTGAGEAVVIDTQLPFMTEGIAILPGYCRDQEVYEKNGRPLKITVKCGDTTVSKSLKSFKPDFSDPLKSMIYIEFDEPVFTDTCTVVISEAAGGTQYEDTCIAELFPYAHSDVACNEK